MKNFNRDLDPFKFLENYVKDELKIFFSRKIETELLYKKVQKATLTVLYGRVDTGKTSLVKCGLANKYKEEDWNPLEVVLKRKGNWLQQTKKVINRSAGETIATTQTPLIDDLLLLQSKQTQTIYLILDQFEELFIPQQAENKALFLTFLAALLEQTKLDIKVLIIIRSDTFALLEKLKEEIPTIVDNKMNLLRIEEIELENLLKGIAKKGDIKLEKGATKAILENAKNKAGEVELPRLQVQLHQLQQKASRNAQGQKFFDIGLVDKVGKGEQIVVDFVKETVAKIDDNKTAIAMLGLLAQNEDGFSTANLAQKITDTTTTKITNTVALLEKAKLIKVDENKEYTLKHPILKEGIATLAIPESSNTSQKGLGLYWRVGAAALVIMLSLFWWSNNRTSNQISSNLSFPKDSLTNSINIDTSSKQLSLNDRDNTNTSTGIKKNEKLLDETSPPSFTDGSNLIAIDTATPTPIKKEEEQPKTTIPTNEVLDLEGLDCEGILEIPFGAIGGPTTTLETEEMLLLSEGDIEFKLKLSNDGAIVYGQIFHSSTVKAALKAINKGDAMVFVARNGTKKTFKFVDNKLEDNIGSKTLFVNQLKMTKNDLEWLARNKITQISYSEKTTSILSNYNLNTKNQTRLQRTAGCLWREMK